jgi:hypothetical protein
MHYYAISPYILNEGLMDILMTNNYILMTDN